MIEEKSVHQTPDNPTQTRADHRPLDPSLKPNALHKSCCNPRQDKHLFSHSITYYHLLHKFTTVLDQTKSSEYFITYHLAQCS